MMPVPPWCMMSHELVPVLGAAVSAVFFLPRLGRPAGGGVGLLD